MSTKTEESTDRNSEQATGVPLFVDTARDLPHKKTEPIDSWYVTCMFESQGKTLGFEWHQGFVPIESQTEFLLTNATDNIWRPHTDAEKRFSSKNGADTDTLKVFSRFGTLAGDRSRMTLKLEAEGGAVDVTLTPHEQTVYNGTTGLLPLFGMNSYQYAFPNMTVDGTVTIDGTTYPVEAATAWFDRQWGSSPTLNPVKLAQAAGAVAKASWSWLGLAFGADNRQALSFWDVYEGPGKRTTFATVLLENGVQMNVDASVTYDRIWASAETGYKYPNEARILAPSIDLELHLDGLVDQPEFVYRSGNGHNGGQAPCRVTGHLGATQIDKPAFFEMIGSVGG
ncbi:lipocalin-like domain-containing protein [Actinoplanes sp. CA-131856]